MQDILPKNSIVINKVINGFVVKTKGTMKQQEDDLDGVYTFETIGGLVKFIEKSFCSKVDKSCKACVCKPWVEAYIAELEGFRVSIDKYKLRMKRLILESEIKIDQARTLYFGGRL